MTDIMAIKPNSLASMGYQYFLSYGAPRPRGASLVRQPMWKKINKLRGKYIVIFVVFLSFTFKCFSLKILGIFFCIHTIWNEYKTTNSVFFSTRTASSPKLDLPCDSFPPFDPSQLNEYECSVNFFFKQKTAYEITTRLVGSEMCIRDSCLRLKWRKGNVW